jgi:hypothetical protein
MKAYGGVNVYIHIFLTSALVGDEWSASRPGRFTPWESPGTYWIGGWVSPRAVLDDVEKRKFLILPGLELRPLGRPARIRVNKSMRMSRVGRGNMRNARKILVGKSEGNKQLGRHRQRWAESIKNDIKEKENKDPNWIHLAADRGQQLAPVNKVIDFYVLLNVRSFVTG